MPGGGLVAMVVSTLWIVMQICLTRFGAGKSGFKSMLAGYIISLPFVYAAYWVLPLAFPNAWIWLVGLEHPLGILFHAYLGHLLIFFLYVECFYHIERSVTLRLLIEIRGHPGVEPTSGEISANYNVDEMIAQRLAVLEMNRYLERSGERFCLLPRGRRFAAGVRFFSWLFRSKTQDERL